MYEVNTNTNGPSKDVRAMYFLILVMLIGVLLMVLFSLASAERHVHASVLILLAGANLLIGGFLGFLFGIPRTLQVDDPNKSIDYKINTNLEQISDWLTKMIVGVSLTQLNNVPEIVNNIALSVAPKAGSGTELYTLTVSIIIIYVILGFLFGYLWTRLFLVQMYKQADLGHLKSSLREIDQFTDQQKKDKHAINLVEDQLNHSSKSISDEDIFQALKQASQQTRTMIFHQAQSVRSTSWRENKAQMERTLPVFRALIKNDPQNIYHRNYAQVGYIYKDCRNPDWSKSLKYLNKAIKLRGPWEEKGWLYYEYNRAVCKIMLDEEFANNKASLEANKEAILNDLKPALSHITIRHPDEHVENWLKLNKVDTSAWAL